ncbi:hypothetical protein F8M41_005182 [Gigaspora margarita]|uniref:Uncharacterized protein n=1 Tax=Gigaspora margarita TaxID=4874 RepID=A0A8H4A6B8_GIGMA|nr:hypothetical protein F8M41_005182 [Gigaspora margarita]
MSNLWRIFTYFIDIIQFILLVPFYNGLNIYVFCNNTSSSWETNSSVEIAEEINSFSNPFGKDIVKISFPCEININKAYYEAWKEIIKFDKNKSKYKLQDYSSKVFAPWSIILWSLSNALYAILISIQQQYYLRNKERVDSREGSPTRNAAETVLLPNNILFTNIQEMKGVIEGYLLMNENQDTVNDNMITIIRIVEEINKKFEKFEA